MSRFAYDVAIVGSGFGGSVNVYKLQEVDGSIQIRV
jgi:hypothetical protein